MSREVLDKTNQCGAGGPNSDNMRRRVSREFLGQTFYGSICLLYFSFYFEEKVRRICIDEAFKGVGNGFYMYFLVCRFDSDFSYSLKQQ